MSLNDIFEGAITIFIVIILMVVMAPVVIEIGKATSQEWYGYFGAGILVVFSIIVLFGVIVKIFNK